MMKENNRLIDENEVQAMENIRANAEIYTLSSEERQVFVEATQVVYEEYMENGLLTRDELARMKRIIRGEEEREYPYR
jgi:C4-dicarboxylate-binding protein DctP